MFYASNLWKKFGLTHHRRKKYDGVKNVSVYGQEFTSATFKLAEINLFIRGNNDRMVFFS